MPTPITTLTTTTSLTFAAELDGLADFVAAVLTAGCTITYSAAEYCSDVPTATITGFRNAVIELATDFDIDID